MRCPDCDGTGQHPVDVQCMLCEGRGHDGSDIGWPHQHDPEPEPREE
jgi:hypothetical protein